MSPESAPSGPEHFATSEQAYALRGVFDSLISHKGVFGTNLMADPLPADLPEAIASIFPPPKTEAATPPKYALHARQALPQLADMALLVERIPYAESPIAVSFELQQAQWIHLDKPIPGDNRKVCHVVYNLFLETNNAAAGLAYTLDRFTVINNCKLPLTRVDYPHSELRDAVPAQEAKTLIEYCSGLATEGRFDQADPRFFS